MNAVLRVRHALTRILDIRSGSHPAYACSDDDFVVAPFRLAGMIVNAGTVR